MPRGAPIRSTLVIASLWMAPSASAQWRPQDGPLRTRWAKDVTPQNAHAEHPRPQLAREAWLNLNGLWDYAITPREAQTPSRWDGQILVPFPVESALSGVMKRVAAEQRVWYRRQVEIPPDWDRAGPYKVLLHFGAVDWETSVHVNGQPVGHHRGGYDPFTLDITQALRDADPQEVVVGVWDPTDAPASPGLDGALAATQPRGKQVSQPQGIWYTPTTGIWQTVWLERAPQAGAVERIHLVAQPTQQLVRVHVEVDGADGADWRVSAEAYDDEQQLNLVSRDTRPVGEPLDLRIPAPRLWAPHTPFLYQLKVTVHRGPHEIDRVRSYFGMREVSLCKDENGFQRICLNGEPLFVFGPLDQGFWPDGLYAAPSDEALRYDLEVTKRLGFNAVRKHVKVEPERWYYWCDRLGLLVLQDMPSGAASVAPGQGEIQRSDDSKRQFESELLVMIRALRNHPSIILWVPFNEGWGQYDTVGRAKWIHDFDPTRLVDCASGWNDFPAGHVHDIHSYPGPASPRPADGRAAMLGEFGGLGLPIRGHTWQDEKNWGYRSFDSPETLSEAYVGLIERLRPLIAMNGLSAAIYTQTTDVESEVNGLMTYDREVLKLDERRIVAAHRKLFEPPPLIRTLIASSREAGRTWRYTTEPPAEGWQRPGFDDTGWREGVGGFGRAGTPGAVVRTQWHTSDIWLRGEFPLDAAPAGAAHLLVHHDEDADVYIHGKAAARLSGYTTDYVLAPILPEASAELHAGKLLLAIHCRQTAGGQYIDAGLVDVIEREK